MMTGIRVLYKAAIVEDLVFQAINNE